MESCRVPKGTRQLRCLVWHCSGWQIIRSSNQKEMGHNSSAGPFRALLFSLNRRNVARFERRCQSHFSQPPTGWSAPAAEDDDRKPPTQKKNGRKSLLRSLAKYAHIKIWKIQKMNVFSLPGNFFKKIQRRRNNFSLYHSQTFASSTHNFTQMKEKCLGIFLN